jgi:hypothetical protein
MRALLAASSADFAAIHSADNASIFMLQFLGRC